MLTLYFILMYARVSSLGKHIRNRKTNFPLFRAARETEKNGRVSIGIADCALSRWNNSRVLMKTFPAKSTIKPAVDIRRGRPRAR